MQIKLFLKNSLFTWSLLQFLQGFSPQKSKCKLTSIISTGCPHSACCRRLRFEDLSQPQSDFTGSRQFPHLRPWLLIYVIRTRVWVCRTSFWFLGLQTKRRVGEGGFADVWLCHYVSKASGVCEEVPWLLDHVCRCSMCLVFASKAAATFLAQQSHSDHLVAVHDVTYKV